MSKLKLFVESFLVYGLGGIISRIIPFIMIPVITWIMPNTKYYGIYDMSVTLVYLGSALAVMGMYDAMYRMFFEKEDEDFKKDVCSTTIHFTIVTSILVFILIIILNKPVAKIFFRSARYSYVVFFSAATVLFSGINTVISAPIRMQNKRKLFIIVNTIGPLISYTIAIPLLLMGYYIIALPLAAVISESSMMITYLVINRKWFSFKRYDKKLLKQLLVIAIPLIPNFLIYWLFNSCDKVMVSNILGVSATGVYSVGAKLGLASQLIYMAFAGGWQFFAFSTMKEKNQVENNSKVFEYLGIISFVATAFVCAWSYGIFKLLFKPDYLDGYIIAPYLFLAPLLQMLFQVAANQFLVVKKTWPNVFILLSGAVINIIINLVLIPVLGIEGASIATLLGYIVSDVVCVVVLCRMKLMSVSRRFVIASVLLVLFIVVWRVFVSDMVIVGTVFAFGLLGAFLLLYIKEILGLFKKTVEKD